MTNKYTINYFELINSMNECDKFCNVSLKVLPIEIVDQMLHFHEFRIITGGVIFIISSLANSSSVFMFMTHKHVITIQKI